MAITLDAITLPDDLIWSDEYSWSPVTQTINKSLTGALIVQEAAQAKGRPYTLSGSAESAWIDKATLDLIQAKADTPELVMSLNYHGTVHSVIFLRSGNSSPFDADPIYELADPQADHLYSFTIRLIEV